MKYTNYKKLDSLSDMIPSGTPEGWLYIGDDNVRYLLGEPKEKNVLVFGINPSTATPFKTDRTITKVRNICHNQDSDCGWIMANIFPLRSTKPDNLPVIADSVLSDNNIHILSLLLKSYHIEKVWAAWGNIIWKRDYLIEELFKIYRLCKGDNSLLWYHTGSMTKGGNPRHPLYLKKDSIFEPFDILEYLCGYNVLAKKYGLL